MIEKVWGVNRRKRVAVTFLRVGEIVFGNKGAKGEEWRVSDQRAREREKAVNREYDTASIGMSRHQSVCVCHWEAIILVPRSLFLVRRDYPPGPRTYPVSCRTICIFQLPKLSLPQASTALLSLSPSRILQPDENLIVLFFPNFITYPSVTFK